MHPTKRHTVSLLKLKVGLGITRLRLEKQCPAFETMLQEVVCRREQ